MRDIRFRAKRILDGVWVQGQIYEHCPPILCLEEQTKKSKWYIIKTAFADWNMERGVDCFEVDPKTICQFTGEVDKNGTDIFENDIVKMRGHSSPFKNSVVYFKGGKFAVNGTTYGFKDLASNTYTVLGNIFDNGDLIK